MKNSFSALIGRVNKTDTFSPYFFLPFVLVLYFFTSLFDFHRFAYFDITVSVWPAVITALAAYFAGVCAADRWNWELPDFRLSFLRHKTIYVIWALFAIGLVAYLIMLFTGQVGLVDESVRRQLDPRLYLLSQLLWFTVLILLSVRVIKEETMTRKKLLFYGAIFGIVVLLFLIMGYRTPLLIMVFTAFIIFHCVIRRIKLTWLLATLIVLGVLFSMFGFLRFISEDPTKAFNSREQPDVELADAVEAERVREKALVESVPEWIRFLNGESVTGHVVLSKIIEYTREEGYLLGEIHGGVAKSVLPGEQISPRMQVTEIVNSLSIEEGKYVTRPNRTTTPTFIGQLFLDGGYVLIFIGFLIYGLVASALYNQVKRAGTGTYQTIAYAFVTTVFTVSLHTGLLDLIFILMLGFMLLTAAIEKNKGNNLAKQRSVL